MALGSERYQTLDIFICEDTYHPKGVCYGDICTDKSISVKETDLSETVKTYVNGVLLSSITTITGKRYDIYAYIKTPTADTHDVTAYLLPIGSDENCLLSFPPCSDIDVDSTVNWSRNGHFIIADLPVAQHCGVDKFKTEYTVHTSYFTPTSIGEADGESPALTFDDDGVMKHTTSLSSDYLTPGKQALVSYGLRGVEGYYPLGIIDFQTTTFTSALFLGCGLVKKQKVYNNPLNLSEGYTYKYVPYEGGDGFTFQPDWAYSTEYRCLVEFKGVQYWLKSTDFTSYTIRQTVFIAKSMTELPLNPDADITQSCVAKTLSQTKDMIVTDYFYGV